MPSLSVEPSVNGMVPPEPARAVRHENVPRAIALMLGSTFVFTCTSALSKWLIETYPIGEVLFSRVLVPLIGLAIIILPRTGLAVFRTKRLKGHLLRGVSQSTSQTFLMIAFSLMPLASAVAINFSAPIFATLASIILFRETVGIARWSAILVGFIGVMIVTSPGTETFTIGALFALANAVLYGTVTAGVRDLTSTESTETLTLYQMLIMSAAFSLALPFAFVLPTWADTGWLILNGVGNGLAQYGWTRALHLAPTSAVTPFQYFSLIWAMLLGFAIWGDVPTVSLLIGAAIVAGSGLFLLWRESRKRGN
ncbi:MAG: EamA family transporter [Rhizobiales bacterium]|nr:EamA family transporter [Hyphomicrobiales bacterium]